MDARQRTYLMSIVQKAMDDCCTPSGVVSDSSEKKEDKKDNMKVIVVVVSVPNITAAVHLTLTAAAECSCHNWARTI